MHITKIIILFFVVFCMKQHAMKLDHYNKFTKLNTYLAISNAERIFLEPYLDKKHNDNILNDKDHNKDLKSPISKSQFTQIPILLLGSVATFYFIFQQKKLFVNLSTKHGLLQLFVFNGILGRHARFSLSR